MGKYWVTAVFAASVASLSASSPGSASLSRDSVVRKIESLPLHFEPNRGQAASDAQFVARGRDHMLRIDPAGATFLAGGAKVRLTLLGSRRRPVAEGLDALPGRTNYLLGNDPARHIVDVPQYGKVRYRNVYPGIDLIYNGRSGKVEFDFVLAPGADPSRIHLRIDGGRPPAVDHGDLCTALPDGELRLPRPVTYQESASGHTQVAADYVLHGSDVRLRLGAFDRHKALTIDPTLSYLTYVGGSSWGYVNGVAVDPSANIWVAGYTTSTDIPVVNPMPGQASPANAFVGKLNATGTAWLFLTYLGGSTGGDSASAIAVDPQGNGYVTGTAASSDFPLLNPVMNFGSVFILEINSSGNALVYSTRYPASGGARAIAVDPAGDAYVTGTAESSDGIPLIENEHMFAYQSSCASTCAYVVEVLNDGISWAYSTYLGGSKGTTQGYAIAVDTAGNAYVTGETSSTDFPLANALQSSLAGYSNDAFVTKFVPGGASVAFSTYLGGSGGNTQGNAISVDGNGNIYVAGQTNSSSFPVLNAAQQSPGAGWDAFVTAIKADYGGYLYSTYLGGWGDDIAHGIAVATDGTVTVAGSTLSFNFPLLSAAQTAHGSPGGVYHSGDGGADWTGPGSSGGVTINGIAIDSGNAQNMVAATSNLIYRSADGGATWSRANSMPYDGIVGSADVTSVAADPTHPCVFYAGLTSGLYSPWPPPPYNPNYPNLVVTSADCGANWSSATSADWAWVEQIMVAGDGGLWYTVLENTYGGEFLCHNGNPPSGTTNCSQHYSTYVLAATGCYLLIGDSTGKVSLATGEFMLTCTGSFNDTGAAFGEPVTAVAMASPSLFTAYLLAGTKSGRLYRQQVGSGNSWDNVGTLDGTVNSLAAASYSGTVYAGTSAGSVYQSTDGGATWNPTAFSGEAGPLGEAVKSLAVSPAGVVHAGTTCGGADAFVTRLTPAGAIAFSTFLGGNSGDIAYGVAAGASDTVWVAGETGSSNLPVSSNAVQKSLTGSYYAGFIAEITGLNNIATPPALSIVKTHSGNFLQGQNGATYTLTVSNAAGAGPTSGTVTVQDTLPTGLSLASMAGTNWDCSSNSCTRSDSLNGGTSYPPIVVTVNLAHNAAAQVTNQASVSGGGSATASASDPAMVYSACDVNQETTMNVADVQTMINEALAISPANNDLNSDGIVNVLDVQLVINAVLTGTCS